jgi:hypothetical protein
MLQKLSPVVSSWEAPSWATVTTTDEDAIDYAHVVGSFPDRIASGPLTVMAIQRDDLKINGTGCTVSRTPAEILIGGERITANEARDLAAWLVSVADLISGC